MQAEPLRREVLCYVVQTLDDDDDDEKASQAAVVVKREPENQSRLLMGEGKGEDVRQRSAVQMM